MERNRVTTDIQDPVEFRPCRPTALNGEEQLLPIVRDDSAPRTRIYEKEHTGLAPDGAPSHRASQPAGTPVHSTQTAIDDNLKEVLASWPSIPAIVREAIVAIIRCAIPKDGDGMDNH